MSPLNQREMNERGRRSSEEELGVERAKVAAGIASRALPRVHVPIKLEVWPNRAAALLATAPSVNNPYETSQSNKFESVSPKLVRA